MAPPSHCGLVRPLITLLLASSLLVACGGSSSGGGDTQPPSGEAPSGNPGGGDEDPPGNESDPPGEDADGPKEPPEDNKDAPGQSPGAGGSPPADDGDGSTGSPDNAGDGPATPEPGGEEGDEPTTPPENDDDPVTTGEAAGSVLLLADAESLRRLAPSDDGVSLSAAAGSRHLQLSVRRNTLFAAAGKTLTRYPIDDDRHLGTAQSRQPALQRIAALAVGEGGERVWVTGPVADSGWRIIAYGPELTEQWRRNLQAPVVGLAAYFEAGSGVRVVQPGTMRAFAADGTPGAVSEHGLGDTVVAAARTGADRLWLASAERLQVHVSGQPPRSRRLSGVRALRATADAGVWAVTERYLIRLGNDLGERQRVDLGVAGVTGKVVASAANPGGDSLWFVTENALWRATIDGAVTRQLPLPDGVAPQAALAVYVDTLAPELRFLRPDGRLATNDTTPELRLAARRVGTPIDLESVSLTADDEPLPADCREAEPSPSEERPDGVVTLSCAPAALPEGEHALAARIADVAGNESEPATATLVVDTTAPTVQLDRPKEGAWINADSVRVSGDLSETATVTINGEPASVDGDNAFAQSVPLTGQGTIVITVVAEDGAGNRTEAARSVRRDTLVPAPADAGSIDTAAAEGQANTTRVTGEPGSVEPNTAVLVENTRTGERVQVLASNDGRFVVTIGGRPEDTYTITLRDPAENVSEPVTLQGGALNPPPIEPGGSLMSRASFLYEGANPVQRGVTEGTIEERRFAVIRGKVVTRAGEPLPGVTVSVRNHPEFGMTKTRANGRYDLAVSGGGTLVLDYRLEGRLPAQRRVQVQWEDYAHVDDVALIPLDDRVSVIDLSGDTSGIQVARGSVEQDAAGKRQVTLLFAEGVRAQITRPDGTTKQLNQLDVRATEYTVGPNGPAAMPGELPPSSAYTYAVELSVDQALEQGVKVNGKDVTFSKPVPFYVDNFLDFPTGEAVPVGYYNSDKGAWIPTENGRIVKIIDERNGNAVLDVTGEGKPATDAELAELNLTKAERTQLANLYEPGDSLWRFTTTHLSTWDCNWPYGPPEDAREPDVPEPREEEKPDTDEEDECPGCTIRPQTQSLGEEIPIAGTPFSLHYQSNRAAGAADNSVVIPLTGDDIPDSLKSVELTIYVAGKRINKTFAPMPNQNYTFTWDGSDGFGRKRYGTTAATVRLAYHYGCVYYSGSNGFGQFGGRAEALGTRYRCRGFDFSQTSVVTMESPVNRPSTVGNWSLSNDHFLFGRTLLRGDGERYEGVELNRQQTVFAGTGTAGFSGDGGQATDAELSTGGRYGSHYLAIAPNGTVYIMDDGNHRIRAVSPDGIIRTVAGTGVRGYSGDGGAATEAKIDISARGRIAAGPEGNIYFASMGNHVVRRISPNGTIQTVAGTGESGDSGDGGPATEARLGAPTDIAVGRDGTLFITDYGNDDIRVVDPSGTISTIDNVPLYFPMQIWGANEGVLYVRDHYNIFNAKRIWRIDRDGSYRELTRDWEHGVVWPDSEDRPQIRAPDAVFTNVGPDGTWYEAKGNTVIERPILSGSLRGKYVIPSRDGDTIYNFDNGGLHVKTVNADQGTMRYRFVRNEQGELTAIVDGDGNTTTIERTASGTATAIVAQDGQRTELSVDSRGYLTSGTDPTGAAWSMAYTAGGLLTRFTDRAGATNRFTYDDAGRLIEDRGPKGSGWTLSRSELAQGHRVTMISGAGRTSTFELISPDSDTRIYTNTAPDGTVTKRTETDVGDTTTERPSGTTIARSEGPDPRFGLGAPVVEQAEITTPAGLTRTVQQARTADVPEDAPPTEPSQLTHTVTVNGRTIESLFTGASQTWTTTTPEGRQATAEIDAQGRPTRTQLGPFAATERTYDTRGRLTEISRTANGTTRTAQLAYDASGPSAGYLRAITGPTGRTVTYTRDALGRVIQQIGPDGEIIGFGYDNEGRLTKVDPPGQPKHVLTFDGNGSRTAYDPPDVGGNAAVTNYRFNADQQLIRVERPDGKTVNVTYDSAGKRSRVTAPAGTWTYGYNATSGKLSNLTAPGGQALAFTRDGPLLTKSQWSGPVSGAVERAYDDSFRLTQQTVGGQSIAFTYDADSLLVQAGDLSITRASDHPGITATSINGVTTSRSYNGFGELAAYAAKQGGASVYSATYTRDAAGRITEVERTVDSETTLAGYTYDDAGRLAAVSHNGAAAYSYTYDANGNRVRLDGPAVSATAEYDARDRLLRYADTSYTYSEAGDLTSKTAPKGTTTYDYDALGNLREVEQPDGTTIEYIIDGRNRRVGKKVNGALEKGWLYQDALNPIAQTDGQGNVTARFVYGTKPNVPAYMIKDGTQYRLITDARGSVRLVVNTATGAIAQRLDYSPFGRVVTDTNTGFQPFGFAGGLYDPDTGLLRFGAREYDAETGRWTTSDPIRFAGGDSNLYGYVVNDPINWIDVLGLEKWHIPNDSHTVGRPNTIIPPGGTVGTLIENRVASGYTFGTTHDTWVGNLTGLGVPDTLANIPTMVPAYFCAVYKDNAELPLEKRPRYIPVFEMRF